jgi:hypothetical protein
MNDLIVMDENRISIMGVQIYVKCLIYSTATPLEVINAFDLLMTQTRDGANIDKVKLLRCIYHSEQQDRKNIKIVKSDLTLPKEVCLNLNLSDVEFRFVLDYSTNMLK